MFLAVGLDLSSEPCPFVVMDKIGKKHYQIFVEEKENIQSNCSGGWLYNENSGKGIERADR